MTMELDAAIRRAYPGVDFTIERGVFTYWSTGTPPTEQELRAALDTYRQEQAAREQAAAVERDELRALLAKLEADTGLTAAEQRRVLRALLRRAV